MASAHVGSHPTRLFCSRVVRFRRMCGRVCTCCFSRWRVAAGGPLGGSPKDSDRLAAVSSEPFGPSLVLGSVPSSEILGRAHLAESQAAMQAGEARTESEEVKVTNVTR